MSSSQKPSLDSRRFLSQQMLKIERKDKILFLQGYYTLNVLYMMDLKSMVSHLEKIHFGSDLDDGTMYK